MSKKNIIVIIVLGSAALCSLAVSSFIPFSHIGPRILCFTVPLFLLGIGLRHISIRFEDKVEMDGSIADLKENSPNHYTKSAGE